MIGCRELPILVTFVAVGCTLLAGCGSNASDGTHQLDAGTAEDPGAAYRQFIDDYDRSNCEREERCDPGNSHSSVEACVAEIDAALTRGRERIATSIDAGRITYDAAAAADCLVRVAGDCQSAQSEILASCAAVVEGVVEPGGECIGHFDCAGDSRCFASCEAVWGNEEVASSGQCVAESPIGTSACP